MPETEGDSMADVLPTWDELSEDDKAQVVVFLRTVESEGTDYAWENYEPQFGAESPLNVVDHGGMLTGAYRSVYDALHTDEFWRLYNLGTR
jgi:hypothetical protein